VGVLGVIALPIERLGQPDEVSAFAELRHEKRIGGKMRMRLGPKERRPAGKQGPPDQPAERDGVEMPKNEDELALQRRSDDGGLGDLGRQQTESGDIGVDDGRPLIGRCEGKERCEIARLHEVVRRMYAIEVGAALPAGPQHDVAVRHPTEPRWLDHHRHTGVGKEAAAQRDDAFIASVDGNQDAEVRAGLHEDGIERLG
jgi:hypothetical protein